MLDKTQNVQNIANGIKLSVVDLPKPIRERYDVEVRQAKKEKKKKDSPSYVTMFLSEVLGTGLLLFLGCMGCIPEVDSTPPTHHMSSLSFGLVITLIIQVFGHISGAHLNPAVTLVTVLFKILTPAMGAVYVAAQFIGATLGFGLLKILLPDDYTKDGFCATKPHTLISPAQAVAIETIITTVLILVCCAIWDKRNAGKPDSIPLRFGFIIVAISMCAGPFTGASMNTARTFAPVIYSGDWANQWIYWIGPTLGGLLGFVIYKYLFALPESEESSQDEQIHLEDVNGIAKV